MTSVYAIPASRPGYTGYFISTPPSSYHSPSWMSYPPEPEDVPPQWAESVRICLTSYNLLSGVQFCNLACIPRCHQRHNACGINLMQPEEAELTLCVSTLFWMWGPTRPLEQVCYLTLFVYTCYIPNAFTECLFAEPVSFRNHLLNWINRWRWVDTTNSSGRWAHFFKWTLLIFNYLSLSQVQGCALFRIELIIPKEIPQLLTI